MTATTITIGSIAAALSVACWVLFISGVGRIVRQLFLGQKSDNRVTPVLPRMTTLVKEFAAHTRMVKFRTVGWAHWLVMVGFLLGAILWFEAYGQTFDPDFHWPVIGAWKIYLLADELLGLGTVIGIVALMVIRQRNHPRRPEKLSRFAGSNFSAAYFVEWVVLLEGLGMIFVKTFKIAAGLEDPPIWTSFFTHFFAMAFTGIPEIWVSIAAVVKLMSGMVWLAVVGRNITWGVAWHRFSAFFNIYLKREADGSVALGAAKPMMSAGKPLDMESADPDNDTFGAGAIEDFTWKGWLDFTTCTECGRCQSQCPAWNTGKPLSPKLLITSLRDHATAKAPYLLAGGKTDMAGDEVGLVDSEGNVDEAKLAAIPEAARAEAARKLVGPSAGSGLIDDDALGAVVDTDTLWSCTNCGACVEQCPVDIEHVDHIIDMRRYQVLIESDFPTELAGLFKNLENKGNPWGQNSSTRNNWIDEIDIDIPVYGKDVDSFEGFEYLFWVGCAGAFEDRAKKTTKAVAELLDIAAVNFMVLGDGETCTGDSARRAGNEFLFQMLAQQNIETLGEVFATAPTQPKKIVVTCAHCFNALGNEYRQLGAPYEVVHHTQLLNRLVRDKRLIPVAPVSEDVTYHDPCFLGRHNKVYSEPRELMAASGSSLREMPRHGERSMCCGAGGARMWMEEHIGKRINIDRVDEALDTLGNVRTDGEKPQKIATGCPFCRVMLSDGTTAQTANTDLENKVEVVDVAQLLLDSVTRGATPVTRGGRYLGPASPALTLDVAEHAPAEAAAAPAAAETATATSQAPAEKKPTVGLGMGKGMKRPGAAASTPGASASAPSDAAPAAEPKAKGFGMSGAKRPGQAKPSTEATGSTTETPSAQATPTDTAAAETAPEPKPKAAGFGMGGAKRPGQKAASPARAESAAAEATPSESTAAESSATDVAPAQPAAHDAAESIAPEPKAKGFGMGAAKRPGQKAAGARPTETSASAPSQPAAATPAPAEPAVTNEKPAATAASEPKAKGFGMGAAKRPGHKAPAQPTEAATSETATPAAADDSAAVKPAQSEPTQSEPAQSEPTQSDLSAASSDSSSDRVVTETGQAKSAGFGIAKGKKRPGS